MKRAPIVLSSTIAGLAVTLGFHAHTPAVGASTPAAASTTTGSASTTGTTTVTSAVEANQYGNVQLKLTVSGGKITAVQALQLPQNDPRSSEINASAEPILQASALAAQSADIDAVSGATYTSDSYRLALQSALDKAGLGAATTTS